MTPTITNSDTQTTIQTSTPRGSDIVTSKQGESGTNQVTNRDYQRNAMVQNHKNRGDNQHTGAVTLQDPTKA